VLPSFLIVDTGCSVGIWGHWPGARH
jgi:hypothetical protein